MTSLLRLFPPEISHLLALKLLDYGDSMGLKIIKENSNKESVDLFGLKFKNRLGLAGGMDKNGEHINSLTNLGFGFLELGTVTPKPQPGNDKPRLFRDVENLSLINSMGFNNKGVTNLIENIKSSTRKTKIMVSIGKNFNTPNEKAVYDYLYCFEKVVGVADLVSINISSPNTKELFHLQFEKRLPFLLNALKESQLKHSKEYGYKPLIIKISPDLSNEDLNAIALNLTKFKIDGLIATNTSVEHDQKLGNGGLSGKLLYKKSTETLKFMRKKLGKDFPIIASGGVMDIDSYKKKLDSGADLVQIYTGLIFYGPELIQDIFNSD